MGNIILCREITTIMVSFVIVQKQSEKTEWFFRHAYQDASDEIKILYEV